MIGVIVTYKQLRPLQKKEVSSRWSEDPRFFKYVVRAGKIESRVLYSQGMTELEKIAILLDYAAEKGHEHVIGLTRRDWALSLMREDPTFDYETAVQATTAEAYDQDFNSIEEDMTASPGGVGGHIIKDLGG